VAKSSPLPGKKKNLESKYHYGDASNSGKIVTFLQPGSVPTSGLDMASASDTKITRSQKILLFSALTVSRGRSSSPGEG